ncbi:hypothetical protein [Paenibacillus lautus]|uniref:hypothetical protein n=1 Tax=Paenibacillus lautus TaxID=1401 RepID=UPI001C115F8E|nr:hypothetical protein [Paenibacillus lautus]MBU5349216.1 hypothetical protein [Paenibacillus lautus]
MRVKMLGADCLQNPHRKLATCGTEVPNSLNNRGITGIFKGNTFIQEIDRNYRTKG